MNDLSHKRCIPCEGGAEALTTEEIKEFMDRVPGWTLEEQKQIHKDFSFKDFREALSFINEVGDVAEYEGHHPDLFLHNWNKVRVSLSTHALKGLSENDFIMASKIDRTKSEMAE